MVIRSNVESVAALRAFVAAAELRSFKGAGVALGITSSAIGKAISGLELQLGCALFHRTTRSVSLTEAGSIYLVRVRNILEELKAAEDEVAEVSQEPRGRLRVGLPLGGELLTSVMARFTALYPGIILELDYSDRLVDVIEEGYDVVIRTGELSASRLIHRKLGSFDWVLAASPSYLEAHGEPRKPSDLLVHTCLRQKFWNGRLVPWPFPNEPDFEAPISLTSTINGPLFDMALCGGGIAAFPSFILTASLANASLKIVLEGQMERRGTYNILWPPDRYRVPKVRAFVDFFFEWLPPRIAQTDRDRHEEEQKLF
ncbi:LysR family transcriptional regulator [Ensifer adhaerens]|uniref:LysR substrate-binding domain-containing protein n=1 Tax=Ensifer canadensis TaxID=555315 RepID=UPI00148F50FF|nr:LysR substrate-binding domain-containing protein [Ensifer canadensis]NOV19177.1 LysR family transcriptional regulator [Ensifer canadensis]